jgi:RsiW-degrading membrane proteinase PrsW (M82 family)
MTVTAIAEIFVNLLWAIVPPILLMLWYARRLKSAPGRKVLFGLFFLGALAGCFAALIELGFDWGAMQIPGWRGFSRSGFGQLLRQFGGIAPIEEFCKLLVVVGLLRWLMARSGRMPAQPGTVLMAAMAVGFGFAAQENVVMLLVGRATVIDRLLLVPGHGIFAAPWGLALGFAICRLARHLRYSVDLVWKGWFVAVLCHGLTNSIALLSMLPGLRDVLFLFFPWILYLAWLTEGILARAQGEPLPGRPWGATLPERLRYFGFGAAALWMGGLAIMHLRTLGNTVIDPWRYAGILPSNPNLNYFLVEKFFQVVILGMAAIMVFRYRILRQDEL